MFSVGILLRDYVLKFMISMCDFVDGLGVEIYGFKV